MPAPSLRKISSTGMRVPRITGFPLMTSGLISIRSGAIVQVPQRLCSARKANSSAHLGEPPPTRSALAGRLPWRLRAAGDGAAGHDSDEMGTVFGAGVDIRVEAVLRDRNVLNCVRREGTGECRFHFGHAKHTSFGAGHCDPHAGAGARDEN